ncbi:unnamed protein product [Cuscuta europaea]|uniref:DUF4283 domain-containing protein n=1 Tax=Cuscuta europaea TaxID=41803 RepID=A0A9P0ZAD9_CUSEU|nr:unnamed protein product [Cuscuta europaea]
MSKKKKQGTVEASMSRVTRSSFAALEDRDEEFPALIAGIPMNPIETACVSGAKKKAKDTFGPATKKATAKPEVQTCDKAKILTVNTEDNTLAVTHAVAVNEGQLTAGSTAKAATPVPWNALFKDNRDPRCGIKLRYIPPKGETVDFGDRVLPSMVEMWGFCLVGHFTGNFPGLKAVHDLKAKWGVKCLVRSHKKGWLIFKFQNEEDRSKVLQGGPYTVFGKLLMLKVLSENFSFEDEEFLKVPIWVKFHDLPLQLWNDEAMSEVASMVGIPITTDKITQERINNDYARVLIEVDVSKPPPLSFHIRLPSQKVFKQSVVYETFPSYCFHCKEFGHHPFICKKLSKCGVGVNKEKEKLDGVGDVIDVVEPGKAAACVPYPSGYGPDPTGSSQKNAQGTAVVEKHAQGPSKLPVVVAGIPAPPAHPTKKVERLKKVSDPGIEVEDPDQVVSEEEDSSSDNSSDTMDSDLFHEVVVTCRDGTKKTMITMKPQEDLY